MKTKPPTKKELLGSAVDKTIDALHPSEKASKTKLMAEVRAVAANNPGWTSEQLAAYLCRERKLKDGVSVKAQVLPAQAAAWDELKAINKTLGIAQQNEMRAECDLEDAKERLKGATAEVRRLLNQQAQIIRDQESGQGRLLFDVQSGKPAGGKQAAPPSEPTTKRKPKATEKAA